MRILVFGGTGLVGSHFVCQALAQKHEIVVVSRNINIEYVPGVTYLKFDLGSKGLEKYINTQEFDVLVYIAYANSGTKVYQRAVTTDAVLELLEIFSASALKHFIFLGSMVVYGESNNNAIIREDSAKIAENMYAKNKLDASIAVMKSSNSYRCTVLHPTAIYSNESERILSYKELLYHHYITFLKGGMGINNIIHASDCASAILACLSRQGEKNEEYILNGETIIFRDWMETIQSAVGQKKYRLPKTFRFLNRGPIKNIFYKTQFRTPLKIPKYKLDLYERKVIYDSSKLKRETGWEPCHKFNINYLCEAPLVKK